jgi:hypothetical protein
MTDNDKNSLDNQNKAAYYQALVNAWFTTRMEKDKQLLTLSSAGVGLIITFQSKLNTYLEFFLWLLTGFCFLTSIFLLLWILRKNSDLIEHTINNNDSIKLEKRVSLMDTLVSVSFYLGVVLAFILYSIFLYKSTEEGQLL